MILARLALVDAKPAVSVVYGLPCERVSAPRGFSIAGCSAVEKLAIRKRLDALARIAMALILVALAVAATRQGVASWLGSADSLARVRAAERWDSSNPDFAVTAAEILSRTPDVPSAGVISSLELAARTAPNRALEWAMLGDAYGTAGDDSAANAAFRHALELFPRSPKINWMYANFLIRSGDIRSAIGPLHLTIEGDEALRTGAFDLAWRAGLPEDRILAAVPELPETLSAYLDYLVRTNRLDAAATVWPRLLAQPGRMDFDAAFRYFDGLLYAHRIDDMARLWSDLARRDPSRIPPAANDSNLLLNGGFEAAPLNGGFDWHLVPVQGAEIFEDSTTASSGSHSLCIHFDGEHNLEFTHVVQYVPVVPGVRYAFTAFARADNITTDSGPRFAIYDAFDHKQLSIETPGMVGTFGWEKLRVEFTTGPATKLLVIQILRPPSTKFDNQIAGALWVDDVSLVRMR
ncbi:MAG TPA: hypothetical protein VLY23_16365 [Candidatus Acidoferrum sp.]|nr:hypothetical protein [Candidatus Acidoferrum sp.]